MAVDFSKEHIKIAKEKKPEYVNPTKIKFLVSDGISLNFGSNYFDFAYSFDALPFSGSLSSVLTTLLEINRVLKKGGFAAINIRTSKWDNRMPQELKEISATPFSIDETLSWAKRCKFKYPSVIVNSVSASSWFLWSK